MTAPAQAPADEDLFDDEADEDLFDDEAGVSGSFRSGAGGPGTWLGIVHDPEAEAEAIVDDFQAGTLDASGCRDLVLLVRRGAAVAASRGKAARADHFHRSAVALARALGYPRAALRGVRPPRHRAMRRTMRRAPRRSHARRARLSAVASAGDGPPSANPDANPRGPRSGAGGAP